MPPNRFESEVESFLEGSHGDRTHIKRADHHTVTPLCGTLLTTRCCLALIVACLLVAPRVLGAPHVLPCWAGLLVAPRVLGAPQGPATREARRPHFVRRRASKPARALRTLRHPPHRWGLV